jgi:exonuclease III
MRIVTLNANGVRSASSKGVFSWLESQRRLDHSPLIMDCDL